MRIIVLVLLLLTCAYTAGHAVAQGSDGVVSGIVRDDAGYPLASVPVVLHDLRRATITDPAGRFVFRGVPTGRHVLRTSLVGHTTDHRELTLEPGDSIDVSVHLYVAAHNIAGSSLPLPSPGMIAEAEKLLPDVLRNETVRTLLERFDPRDTVTIWIPWAAAVPDAPAPVGAHVRITHTCPSCSSGTRSTIEGGRQYRVAVTHLRIGVARVPSDLPVLAFCVDAAAAGEYLMLNCAGTYGRTVTFTRQLSGQWLETTALRGR